jgi:hypothetical protein
VPRLRLCPFPGIAGSAAGSRLMNNFAGRVAASEVIPSVVFGFEFLDAAIPVYHFPAPEGDKPATGGAVHSVT